MQNYFQHEAITAAKKMIRLFYVKKNVEGALSFFSKDRLTFVGIGEKDIFYSYEEVKNYFYKFVDAVAACYKIISADYQVNASSIDSCIVVAKIGFQADETLFNYKFSLHFSFYFQQIDNKILITFVHVHLPEKNSEEKFFNDERLHAEKKLQRDFLNQFENINHIAAKSVRYKDDLPYCYTNNSFTKLLGYQRKINFENYSSLSHIHPNDQQKYFNFLKRIFSEKKAPVSENWRWHNSYCIIYRLINRNREEIKVLEWGNFLSLNENVIVDSFIKPLDEVEITNPNPPPTDKQNEIKNFLKGFPNEGSALLDDCGIHIGDIMLIYPRRNKLFIKGNSVALTPIEFELLLILAAHPKQTLTTKKIYENLWNDGELTVTSFTLKTHVSNLRRKLRDASDNKIQLRNCRGDGYCLYISELPETSESQLPQGWEETDEFSSGQVK